MDACCCAFPPSSALAPTHGAKEQVLLCQGVVVEWRADGVVVGVVVGVCYPRLLGVPPVQPDGGS